MRNAQLTKKIVFWQHAITGYLKMGLPEEFPAPPFHNKIICHTAHEAETWSQKMRDQERIDEQKHADKRGAHEEQVKAHIRSELHNLKANARNQLNRDFLDYWLRKSAAAPNDPTAVKRESYLHVEAFEQGK